jgi:hypothetical protein
MRRCVAWLLMLGGALLLMAWALPAKADVLPEPQRPTDWDEHPAPLPNPPPEKELTQRILLLAIPLSLAGAGLAAARWRARSLGRMEQGR